MNSRGIPLPTVKRLPSYLRLFKEEASKGTLWVSSDFLSDRLGLGAIQVRKDLSMVGAEGRARFGFPVAETTEILSNLLGGDDYADVFIIGTGPLAESVLSDSSLVRHGFKAIAVFDTNPLKVGQKCCGHDILPMYKLPDLVRRMGVKIAVFAYASREGVDPALEAIASSALLGIFDISGLELQFAAHLMVEREDLGSRLAKLASCLGANRVQ